MGSLGCWQGHPCAWTTATPHPQGRTWLQGGQDTQQCARQHPCLRQLSPHHGPFSILGRCHDLIAAASAGPATSAGPRPPAAASLGPASSASPPATLCPPAAVCLECSNCTASPMADPARAETPLVSAESIGAPAPVWVPSARQAGPGWAWASWRIHQKHFPLQKCWNQDQGREGNHILGETQPSPGYNPEQPDVTSKLSLLGDRGWTRDLLGSRPTRITPWLCALGWMASHHQKSWLYLWGLRAFLRQSRAISCSAIRLVKTLLQTICLYNCQLHSLPWPLLLSIASGFQARKISTSTLTCTKPPSLWGSQHLLVVFAGVLFPTGTARRAGAGDEHCSAWGVTASPGLCRRDM